MKANARRGADVFAGAQIACALNPFAGTTRRVGVGVAASSAL
jgi:hypothetical protein